MGTVEGGIGLDRRDSPLVRAEGLEPHAPTRNAPRSAASQVSARNNPEAKRSRRAMRGGEERLRTAIVTRDSPFVRAEALELLASLEG